MHRVRQLGVILIGPPGVGKSTQAARLREEFELTHIATGDLLRDHRAMDTALGREASGYMSTGRLVPDELVLAMVRERMTNGMAIRIARPFYKWKPLDSSEELDMGEAG